MRGHARHMPDGGKHHLADIHRANVAAVQDVALDYEYSYTPDH